MWPRTLPKIIPGNGSVSRGGILKEMPGAGKSTEWAQKRNPTRVNPSFSALKTPLLNIETERPSSSLKVLWDPTEKNCLRDTSEVVPAVRVDVNV